MDSVNSSISKEQEEVVELMDLLMKADPDSPDAELNAVSISDNNGNRIYL